MKSCIASTRIVIEILTRYGISSRPLATRTVVGRGNLGLALGSNDAVRGKPPIWAGSQAGHMVAIIPSRNLLIDASLDQANDPVVDIDGLPCPFIAPVSDDFIAGVEAAHFCVHHCGVFYEPHAIRDAVLQTPEWAWDKVKRRIFCKICAQIDNSTPMTIDEFARRQIAAYSWRRFGPSIPAVNS
jgi:hypothetical protein